MNIFDRTKEIPIEDVIMKYLPDLEFKTSGRWQMARCPFHEDSDPSFGVNLDTNSWYCFGCGRGGSVIDLVMEIQGLGSLEAAKELARAWGIPFQELTPEEKARQQELESSQQLLARYITWAQKQLGPEQREALRRRGLDERAIREFRIGYDPRPKDFQPSVDKLLFYERLGFFNASGYIPAGRIVLPFFEYGKPVYVQFWDWNHRDGPNFKYLNPSGWQKKPVGFDLIRRDKPVYLVEGIFDWLSMRQAGYIAVCTLGTSVNLEYQEYLKRASHIYIMFDNDQKADNPGQKAALKLLREMYPKARNILLPDGKDPNDCCQDNPEGFRELIDRLTGQARDALSLAFERLDNELAKQESKTKVATDEIKTIWQEITLLIASVDSSIERDALAKHFHEKLRPLGVRKSAVEGEIDAVVKTFRQVKEEAAGGEEEEPEPLAVFSGLVDIVEVQETVETDKGDQTRIMPAFLLLDENNKLSVASQHVVGDRLVCPPPRDDKHKIPWLLPRAVEVIRYYREDNNSRLYDDLLVYLKNNSEMPDEKYYDLLATWVFHTYLLEKFQYSPYLWFFAVFERGKSRTGKGLVYVAYRGVHVESLRDAYIVRLANDWKATIFFDVIDLWRKAEKACSEDVLMGRFEKGMTVARVNYPERGAYRDTVYYDIFGPTVVATNVPIGEGLNTRAIQINMPESIKAFNNEIKPELSLPLKERLVAFRARHLNEDLPDIPKPAFKRLGDITRPLLQVIKLVKPEREPILRRLIEELEAEKKKDLAESIEAYIIDAMLALEGENKITSTGCLVLNDIAELVNDGRPEKHQLSNKFISSKLRALGFKYFGQQPGTKRAIYRYDADLLNRLAIHYGLRETKKESETSGTHTLCTSSQTSQTSQSIEGQGPDLGGLGEGVRRIGQTSHEPPNKPPTGEPCGTSNWEHWEGWEANAKGMDGGFPADIFEGEI